MPLKCPDAQVTLVHSDQGVELPISKHLKDNKIERSKIKKHTRHFHSLKTEMIYFQHFISANIGMKKVREYIQYYNNERRHSSLGYLSPAQFEAAIG